MTSPAHQHAAAFISGIASVMEVADGAMAKWRAIVASAALFRQARAEVDFAPASPRIASRHRMHATTSSQVERTPLYRFVAPRYWRAWLILASMRLVYALPLRVQRALGARAGRLALSLAHERPEIGRRNLAVCFPELSAAEARAAARASLRIPRASRSSRQRSSGGRLTRAARPCTARGPGAPARSARRVARARSC
jgi:hypothetical protein